MIFLSPKYLVILVYWTFKIDQMLEPSINDSFNTKQMNSVLVLTVICS